MPYPSLLAGATQGTRGDRLAHAGHLISTQVVATPQSGRVRERVAQLGQSSERWPAPHAGGFRPTATAARRCPCQSSFPREARCAALPRAISGTCASEAAALGPRPLSAGHIPGTSRGPHRRPPEFLGGMLAPPRSPPFVLSELGLHPGSDDDPAIFAVAATGPLRVAAQLPAMSRLPLLHSDRPGPVPHDSVGLLP